MSPHFNVIEEYIMNSEMWWDSFIRETFQGCLETEGLGVRSGLLCWETEGKSLGSQVKRKEKVMAPQIKKRKPQCKVLQTSHSTPLKAAAGLDPLRSLRVPGHWAPLGKWSRQISSYFPIGWVKGSFGELLGPSSLELLWARHPVSHSLLDHLCGVLVLFLPPSLAGPYELQLLHVENLPHVFQLRNAKQQKKGFTPWVRQTGRPKPVPPRSKGRVQVGEPSVCKGFWPLLLSSSPPSSPSPSEHRVCQGLPGSKVGLGPELDIQSLLGQDMTKMTTIPREEKDIFHQGPQDWVSGSPMAPTDPAVRPSHFPKVWILSCQFL